jgi:AcrR family transcriptional regulator
MREQRKDVLRNRQRLVTAAREAFTAAGPDVSLEDIARRAGVGATTLYRHFPARDDLVHAVLDDLITTVREGAEATAHVADPLQAFESMFTDSCDLSDVETDTFLRLAATSPSAGAHAQRLVAELVEPVTSRLRDAGGLHPGITADDIAMLIRMTVAADDSAGRAKAVRVLLAGLTRPAQDGHRRHGALGNQSRTVDGASLPVGERPLLSADRRSTPRRN